MKNKFIRIAILFILISLLMACTTELFDNSYIPPDKKDGVLGKDCTVASIKKGRYENYKYEVHISDKFNGAVLHTNKKFSVGDTVKFSN